jgi:hypothetical protein
MDRGVAQPGSAPRSGRGSRRFKSSRPDQTSPVSIERLSSRLVSAPGDVLKIYFPQPQHFTS